MTTSKFLNQISYSVDDDNKCNLLLFYFLTEYASKGELYKEIIPKLRDLFDNVPNPELPDDWNYEWGIMLPRKDFVFLIDREETDNIDFSDQLSWQGSVLLDASSVESNCNIYLKIATDKFIAICEEWEKYKVNI